MKREEMINLLVQEKIYSFKTETQYLIEVLKYGHRGFNAYSDEELAQELEEIFGHKLRVFKRRPYGVFTLANGTEVLFDRHYDPILQRDKRGNNVCEVSGWIEDIVKESWFYDDSTANREFTKRKCEAATVAFMYGESVNDFVYKWRNVS